MGIIAKNIGSARSTRQFGDRATPTAATRHGCGGTKAFENAPCCGGCDTESPLPKVELSRSNIIEAVRHSQLLAVPGHAALPTGVQRTLARAILDSSSLVREAVAISGAADLPELLATSQSPEATLARVVWTARFEYYLFQALETTGGLDFDAPFTGEQLRVALLKMMGDADDT